ncbi:MAG: hypothetical protein V5A88_01145 [Candidatus Thermoplasmatota archaeon]
MGSLEDLCGKYAPYILIIGMIVVVAGLLVTYQGTARTQEGEEPITGEQYTYEVPGTLHRLGFSILLIGGFITAGGGAMGWWHLQKSDEEDVSPKLLWISLMALLVGLLLVISGFVSAVTADQQVFTADGIPVGAHSHYAVEQLIGWYMLLTGIMVAVAGGIVFGMAFRRTEKGMVQVSSSGKEEEEIEDIEFDWDEEKLLEEEEIEEKETKQRSLLEKSDRYGQWTESYQKMGLIGLLIFVIGGILFSISIFTGVLESGLVNIISIILVFLGGFIALQGGVGYLTEKREEGKERVYTKEGIASLLLFILGLFVFTSFFPAFLILNFLAIVSGYMGLKKGDNTLAMVGLGGGIIIYGLVVLLIIFFGGPWF